MSMRMRMRSEAGQAQLAYPRSVFGDSRVASVDDCGLMTQFAF